MDEYTQAHIKDTNQGCIDYFTLQEQDAYLNTTYDFPFAIKAYINDNTQIVGELQRGKSVKVEYEDIEDYVLKSIEVIEK